MDGTFEPDWLLSALELEDAAESFEDELDGERDLLC